MKIGKDSFSAYSTTYHTLRLLYDVLGPLGRFDHSADTFHVLHPSQNLIILNHEA